MLTVNHVQVIRGSVSLFLGVSFTLLPGQLLIIAGGNGAGKSSLLAAAVGLLTPAAGYITRQAEVFYLGHRRGLRLDLTVLENLQQDIRYPVDCNRLASGLIACGLNQLQSQPLRALSAGQQQRVALAKLWLTQAPLWVLDEPLEALDADMRAVIESRVQHHLLEGGAALVATHIPLVNQTMITQVIELGGDYAL